MKAFVKKSLLCFFTLGMVLNPIEPIAALAKRKIPLYQNEVGPYYGIDRTQKEGNEVLFLEEASEEVVEEESLNEIEVVVSEIQDESDGLDSGFKEREEAERIVDEGFLYEEAIDERTTIYQSEEDPNLKQVVFSQQVSNYGVEGKFYPIETELEEAPTLYGMEGKSGWQNRTNTLQSFYPMQIEDGITFAKGEVLITLYPQFESKGEAQVQGDQLLYPMKEGITFRYQIQAGRIQEEIILTQSPKTNVFEIRIQIEEGKIEDSGNQVLIVRDAQGEIGMLITAPKAYDAVGNETEVFLSYQDGMMQIEIDEAWLNSEERVYPIVIDPEYLGYSHHGVDISVCINQPDRTIGNPDMASLNWVLPADRYEEAYMYIGEHPLYGESYSFYQWLPSQVESVLKGKYIKEAVIVMNQQSANKKNTLNVYQISGNYDIKSATYRNFPKDDLIPISTEPITPEGYHHEIDVTDYIKGVVEKGEANNGVLFALDDMSGYAVFYASEHYYVDGGVGSHTPSTKATYYDSPDVTMRDPNEFTYQLRPFVKTDYQEGLTYFVALGFDGIAPMDSSVEAKLTSSGKTILSQQCAAADNFFTYPDYPKIEGAQEYKTISSNWQSVELIQNLESGKLYELTFQAKKGNQSSTLKKTTFQIVDVKSFDMLYGIADFYGVDVETIKKDNNMQDELITEGNKLFVREPKKNQGIAYVSEDLSTDTKKQIDAALRGRGVQCEFGFEPINLNTGNFLLEAKDSALNVFGETIELTRTYNSSGAMNPGALGYGWSFLSEVRCSQEEKGVAVLLEDGKKLYFQKQTDGTYVSTLLEGWELEEQKLKLVLRSQETTWIFDKSGRLLLKEDRIGNQTVFRYQGNQLSEIGMPDGKTIRFEYDGMLLKKMILPDGRTVQYQINAAHDLVEVIDPSGASVKYQYDENHNLISWIDQNGQTVIQNQYDANHRVLNQIDALGNEVSLQYLPDQTITTDANGNVQTILKDAFLQTRGIEAADGSKEEKVFQKGLLVSEIQENGIAYAYEYDERANLIQSTRSDGFITTYTYDEQKNLIAIQNNAGQSWSYTYDSNHHLLSETDSLGNTKTYTYTPQGQKSSETDESGNVTRYEYDSSGNQIQQLFADGSFQTYTYNAMGFLASITDEKGNTTRILFNERNEKIQEIHADGGVITYQVDPAGNLISITNELGGTTRYVYDALGNLIQKIDPLGYETNYRYDANGNKIEEIAPNGKITSWSYDERNRVISETIQGQKTTYTYNAFGIETITDPVGQVRTNFVDELGRVVTILDFDGLSLHYAYDVFGNRIEETDKQGKKTTYTYDLNQHLIQQETERSVLIFELDEKGQILSTTERTSKWSRTGTNTYNQTGKLIQNTDALGNITKMIYDGNDLIQTIDALGNQTRYEVDAMGRVIREIYADGSDRKWIYDKMGNVILKQDANGNQTRFKYNQRGDLIQEIDALGFVTYYEVDAMGRTTKITSPMGIVQEFEYDLEGRIVRESVGGQEIRSYEYNELGDLISQRIQGVLSEYRYDSYHNLIEVKEATGQTTQYYYDEFHRLIEEKVNGTTFRKVVYNSFDEVIEETDRYGEKTVIQIDEGGQITSRYEKGLTIEYHYDLLGRVIEETDSSGNEKKWTYDALGRLIQEETNGAVSTMEVDLFGNRTKKIDTLGRETSFGYDKEGHLIQTMDANGTVTEQVYDENYNLIEMKMDGKTINRFVYDADGRLIQQIDGEGGIRQMIYDEYNQLIQTIDERGYDRKFYYDSRGNRIEEIDEAGNSIRYGYNEQNQLLFKIDAKNYLTQYRYDSFGNQVQILQPNGGVIQTEYNELNQLVKTIDVLGKETSYDYNSLNLPVSIRVNGKEIAAFQYDALGREIAVVDGNGNKTIKNYDSQNHLIEQIDALGNSVQYVYDSEDQCIRMINEKGIETEYHYDGIGQVIEEIKNGTRVIKTEYDGRGNVIGVMDAEGNKTIYEYDLNDRLIQETDPSGKITHYLYNETGECIEQIDANGNRKQWIFDACGREIQTIDGEGNRITTTYDQNGNILSVQDAKGYRIFYTFDEMGNLLKKSTEEKEVSYTYDLKGQVLSIQDEMGKIESYSYDEFGMVIQIIQKDGNILNYRYDGNRNLIQKNEIDYTYDAKDRLVKMSDENGISEFTYDERDHLIGYTRNGQRVSYTYNDYDEKESAIYPDGSIQCFQYDQNGHLIQSEAQGVVIEYEYDAMGREICEKQSTGLITTKSYDGVGNLIYLKSELNGKLLNEYRYGYDGNDSLIYEERNQLGVQSILEHEYDERDELIKTILKQGEEETITEYRYSINGNRIQVEEGKVIKSFEVNEADQILRFKDEEFEYIYQYDEKGNRIREIRNDGAIKSYEYDELNQLVWVMDFDQSEIRYTYDGLGNLESQTINRENQEVQAGKMSPAIDTLIERIEIVESHPELFEHPEGQKEENWERVNIGTEACAVWQIIKKENKDKLDPSYLEETKDFTPSEPEKEKEEQILYVQDYTQTYPEILSTKDSEEVQNHYYGNQRNFSDGQIYLVDGMGNVVGILSEEMKLIASIDYSDYGERKDGVDAVAKKNEFGYNGEVHTSDGMQYLRSRIYDPKTGVFLQEDSYGGKIEDPISQNGYIYCLNNPLKYADPSGHRAVLNIDLGGSKRNILASKRTVRPSNPTASSVPTLPNKAVAPTVNISRGSVVSQVSSTLSTSIVQTAQQEKEKLLKQKSEITQSLQRAQEGVVQTGVVKRELIQARMSETVSKLNAEVPDIEGSLYDRAMGSCQSSRGTERPYYYDNPFGVEPIEVYYSGNETMTMPIPSAQDVLDFYSNTTAGLTRYLDKYFINLVNNVKDQAVTNFLDTKGDYSTAVRLSLWGTVPKQFGIGASALGKTMIAGSALITVYQDIQNGMDLSESIVHSSVKTAAMVMTGELIGNMVLKSAGTNNPKLGVILVGAAMITMITSEIGKIIDEIYEFVSPWLNEAINNVKKIVCETWDNVKNFAKNTIEEAREFLHETWNGVTNWIDGFFKG